MSQSELDLIHENLSNALHAKELPSYYTETFEPQISDTIAYNRMLNLNRPNYYIDVFSKTAQLSKQPLSASISYKPCVDKHFSIQYADDQQIKHKNVLDLNLRILEYNTINERSLAIEKAECLDTEYYLPIKSVGETTSTPTALLPHQSQKCWPINSFRFENTIFSEREPMINALPYSSIGLGIKQLENSK
eukprot:NODE_92_length_21543_cov_0.719036.p11 type:complete len:191 gc:universal NODE_92_length_21543_cov_0.719036:12601-12029(-)